MTPTLSKNSISLSDVQSALNMGGLETGVIFKTFERKDRSNLHPSLTIETQAKEGREDIFRAIPFMFEREEIYAGLKETQPTTYAALMAGSDFYLVVHEFESFPDEWEATHSTFILCKDRVIGTLFVLPDAEDPLDRPIKEGKFAVQFLGRALGKAYYRFIKGLTLAREFPMSPLESYALPASISNWLPLDTHLMRLDNPQDDYFTRKAILETLKDPIDFFNGHFPDVKRERDTGRQQDPLHSLRCWITNSQTGDLVIIHTPEDTSDVQKDKTGQPHIYHIKNNDWRSFRRIINPIKVIDDYVASILNNDATAFDFTPYLVSL